MTTSNRAPEQTGSVPTDDDLIGPSHERVAPGTAEVKQALHCMRKAQRALRLALDLHVCEDADRCYLCKDMAGIEWCLAVANGIIEGEIAGGLDEDTDEEDEADAPLVVLRTHGRA